MLDDLPPYPDGLTVTPRSATSVALDMWLEIDGVRRQTGGDLDDDLQPDVHRMHYLSQFLGPSSPATCINTRHDGLGVLAWDCPRSVFLQRAARP